MRDAGPADRGGRQSAMLIACLLALTGCSLIDTLKMADAQQGLRDQAHTIQELAEKRVAAALAGRGPTWPLTRSAKARTAG